MDSNPDEFVPDFMGGFPEKWRDTILSVYARVESKDKSRLSFLNDVEITALWDKLQSLLGNNFTEKVMRTLLNEEELSFSFEQRKNASPKRISLNSTQIIMAKQMGISLQEFAKQYAMSNVGEEY